MTSTSSQFIAFFGATGGCANACLVHTLNAGLHATTLARTPSKLTDMLLAQGISQPTIDAQLTIVKGDIGEVAAIKSVLLSNSSKGPAIASQIVSGIGSYPRMQWSLRRPVTIENPEICAIATNNIVQALREIYAEYPSTAQHQPLIAAISTTGISDVCEDVPFGYHFLYHVLLAVPHEDKKEMERVITENVTESDESKRIFRGAIIVRPTLLSGSQDVKGGKGWQNLKVGREDKPAMGYSIDKADVGQWIFEEVVKTGGESCVGQKITLSS